MIENSIGWTGSIDSVRGVVIVHNPDSAPSPRLVHLESQWHFSFASDTITWVAPSELALSEKRIAVLDGAVKRVAVFDYQGIYHSGFGRPGPGPLELERPFDIATSSGTLVIGDAGQAVLKTFSMSGSYIDARPIPVLTTQLISTGDGPVIVETLDRGKVRWKRVEGDSLHFLGDLLAAPNDITSSAFDCVHAVANNQFMFVVSCTRPVIAKFVDYKLERVVYIERPATEPTADQLRNFEKHVRAKIATVPLPPERAERLVQNALGTNRIRKDVHGLAYDPQTRLLGIWSQIPIEFGYGDAAIDLLTVDGLYVARLHLTEPVVDFSMREGHVVVLTSDTTTGSTTLRTYALQLSDAVEAIIGEFDLPSASH